MRSAEVTAPRSLGSWPPRRSHSSNRSARTVQGEDLGAVAGPHARNTTRGPGSRCGRVHAHQPRHRDIGRRDRATEQARRIDLPPDVNRPGATVTTAAMRSDPWRARRPTAAPRNSRAARVPVSALVEIAVAGLGLRASHAPAIALAARRLDPLVAHEHLRSTRGSACRHGAAGMSACVAPCRRATADPDTTAGSSGSGDGHSAPARRSPNHVGGTTSAPQTPRSSGNSWKSAMGREGLEPSSDGL